MPRFFMALTLVAAACAESAAAADSPAVLVSEFIYETAAFPSCHASTIAESTLPGRTRPSRPRPGRRQRHAYHQHGLGTLKRAVRELGGRAIDRRTTLGRALADWRAALINDLGGPDTISTQLKIGPYHEPFASRARASRARLGRRENLGGSPSPACGNLAFGGRGRAKAS